MNPLTFKSFESTFLQARHVLTGPRNAAHDADRCTPAVIHQPITISNRNLMPHIQLKLYATLQAFMPRTGEDYPISPGMTVQEILTQINLPVEKAKLIFIDGTKAELSSRLKGGERVGIFPPVGGG